MMLRKHKTGADKTVPVPIDTPAVGSHLLDSTTGLPSVNHLMELLVREVGRCQRYGDRTALAVFDVKVAAFRPTETHPLPPSPATFIASSIVSNFRAADLACRLDATHFVVILTESGYDGARMFTDRLRTAIGSSPYARGADGTPLYVRAWAGCVAWRETFDTPERFLAAAMADLEQTRVGYDAEQARIARPTWRKDKDRDENALGTLRLGWATVAIFCLLFSRERVRE